jgi:ABC-type Fe3+-siderophore transport system permease subunit
VVSPIVFLCVLGCALVLLFPVISASDDLHAMRAEMEESSPSKRSVSQTAGEKASIWNSRWQNLAAVVATAALLGLAGEAWQELSTIPLSLPTAPLILHASRAPPVSRAG